MLNRLKTSILLVSMCCLPAAIVNAEWSVRGAEIDWSMRAVTGWYGGSYYQIRDRMRSLASDESQLMRDFYEAMLEDARKTDAILVHLEPQLRDATRLTSRKISGSVYAAIQQTGLQEYLRMLGLSLRNGKSPGSTFYSLSEETISLGGKSAYRLEYVTRSPGNTVSRDLVYLIIRSTDYHMLHLTVDERVYRPRLDELKQMLSTLRYHD